MKTERSAGVLIYRLTRQGPKILVLHYDAGHWDFPKGKLEAGETDIQAALREVVEETGITQVKIQPDWKETLHYMYTREGERISKTVVFFLGLTTQTTVRLSDEHKAFAWLSPEKAIEQVTFDTAKKILHLAAKQWKK